MKKNRIFSIFRKIKSFLAINKLRLSAYLCTPSGTPKLKLWLSLRVPKLFSYPLKIRKGVVMGKTVKTLGTANKASWADTIKKDFAKNKVKYLLVLPVVAFYILFYYVPLYGAVISFQDYSPRLGILGSEWVGFKHYIDFFDNIYFLRLIKNTFTLSGLNLIFGFPFPIIFALMLNELRSNGFKRVIQTLSYMPHFISLVIVCSMIKTFCAYDGLINNIIALFGGEPYSILQDAPSFKYVYVISSIWQELGWNSIIYLAALGGINEELYEAAEIDGAGRFKQILHVTLPGILPTIMIMLILRVGQMLNVGYEKILLLYNSATYDTADVISTFIYRKGLEDFDWSFSSAVGLFNSVVNFVFLVSANAISKRTTETGLW